IAPLELHRPRAAEEVDVPPVGRDPRLLFRSVADAEVDLAMLPLCDRHLHRHRVRLLPFRDLRFDVDEVERLQPVQAALAFLHLAEAIAPVRPEPPLPLYGAVAEAGVAG